MATPNLNVANVMAQLNSAEWSRVLGQLTPNAQGEVLNAMNAYASKVDSSYLTNLQADPRQQFATMMGMMMDMSQKLKATMAELDALKASGGGGGGAPAKSGRRARPVVSKPKRSRGAVKKQTTAELNGEDEKASAPAPATDKSRKGSYRFGNAKINYIKPKEGYPNPRDALDKPPAGLVLDYAHGYQGKENYGRGNMFFVKDPKSDASALVYHVAGVGVVQDTKQRTQKFFQEHNDDITCLAVSLNKNHPTLVATGQTDPKDDKYKDMPKIYIWDWLSMKKLKLIPDAHWGMVLKVQFSVNNNYLYSIGGEEEHILKVWDLANLKKKGKTGLLKEKMNSPTCKEEIYGFVVNPYQCASKFKDEFIIFGRKKAYWAGLQADKKGMSVKLKSILFTLMSDIKSNKDLMPKAVLSGDWLPSGKFVIGDNFGAMYICQQTKPLCRIVAHEAMIGAIYVTPSANVITAGNDGHLKRWTVNATSTVAKANWGTMQKIAFADNDFEFLPRAMAYDSHSKTVFVGSRTCQIMSYNMNDGKSEILIDGHDDQVWGLTTCNKDGFEHYYITGGFDGVLKLWDCLEKKIVDTYEFEHEGRDKKQIATCIWSEDGMLVAAGSEDGWLYLFTWFESRALELVSEYEFPVKKGREAEGVAYMRFSHDDKILAVAHMDSNLYLFSVVGAGKKDAAPAAGGKPAHKRRNSSRYELAKELAKGPTWTLEPWRPANHRAAPTHIQWAEDGKMVKTLTRDYEVAHWIVDNDNRSLRFYPHIPDPDDVPWHGDPLVAGWDVQGCYQAEWDGTDLNDITMTEDNTLIATGDDFGQVRLYNYPAVCNKPEAHRAYLGHSSFVVGVEFCRDNKHLITCGGNDMAIFQWHLERY